MEGNSGCRCRCRCRVYGSVCEWVYEWVYECIGGCTAGVRVGVYGYSGGCIVLQCVGVVVGVNTRCGAFRRPAAQSSIFLLTMPLREPFTAPSDSIGSSSASVLQSVKWHTVLPVEPLEHEGIAGWSPPRSSPSTLRVPLPWARPDWQVVACGEGPPVRASGLPSQWDCGSPCAVRSPGHGQLLLYKL